MATDPGLEQALVDQGFVVQEGDAFAFGLTDCADLPDCYASNATGSYLLFSVPPAPGAALPPMGDGTVPPPRTPEGQSVAWQLDPGEAVLVTGRTPPAARYFSLAPYLFERDDDGTRTTVFASVADATNNATLAAAGHEPFDSTTAFLVVADAGVEQRARAALAAAGWDGDAVHTIVLSPSIARLGLEPAADTVMALGRVALFDDPAAGAAYLADVPLEVWRLSSVAPEAAEPLPAPPRTPPRNAGSERALGDAVDALEAAIVAELGDTPHTLLPIVSASLVDTQLAPETCIATLTNCLGEVSDTVYAAGPLGVVLGGGTALLSEAPGERYIVFGVNHEATGLATYANVVLTHWSKRAGIASFESPDMPGSADAYLPDHPDRDALFVVEVARACEGRPHCLELATEFPGVPPSESLAFLFRAYLAPGGTVAPDPAALVTARVIHVTP